MINVSMYQFKSVDADLLPELKALFLEEGKTRGLKGTILLSTEGINAFLSGASGSIDAMVHYIRAQGFSIEPKLSPSPDQPFTRFLVKIKKEIIAMGHDNIKPYQHTAPYVSPDTLNDWLDAGEDVVLLDTRNDYEYTLGTFKGSILLKDLKSFRAFPERVKTDLPEALKKQKVVTFCTGGIRCEKAAAYMEQEGFEQVYQLDGGILKYFEAAHQDHYEGECFVFDKRVAVDKSLNPTETIQCFSCRQPLTADVQSKLTENRACPFCGLSILGRRHQGAVAPEA
jgi:UPF0176 protein